MDEDLRERRRELLKARSYGVSLFDAVKDLSKKYNVSPKVLYRDWRIRRSWIGEVLGIEDGEVFFLEVVAGHKEIQRLATVEFLQADNSNARVGALRLLRELNMDFQEMIVMKGLIERVEKLENNSNSSNSNSNSKQG